MSLREKKGCLSLPCNTDPMPRNSHCGSPRKDTDAQKVREAGHCWAQVKVHCGGQRRTCRGQPLSTM